MTNCCFEQILETLTYTFINAPPDGCTASPWQVWFNVSGSIGQRVTLNNDEFEIIDRNDVGETLLKPIDPKAMRRLMVSLHQQFQPKEPS